MKCANKYMIKSAWRQREHLLVRMNVAVFICLSLIIFDISAFQSK